MRSIVYVLGTSGTGKGTRVRQLLEFLKTKFDHRIVKSEKLNLRRRVKNKAVKLGGKTGYATEPVVGKNAGILFTLPNMKIFIPGCIVKSNKSGLESWNGFDHINSTTGKIELSMEFLKNAVDAFGNVIVEGYPLMHSYRNRPKYLVEHIGLDMLMYQFYYYNDIEEYKQRIYMRSGKLPKAMSSWDGNRSLCVGMYNNVLKEAEEVDIPVIVHKDPYDAPLVSLGRKILGFYNLLDLVPEFEEYTKRVKWLRSVESCSIG